VTISSWLNFGRPAPPGRGSAAGRKLLAPPYYSQRAVFASPLSAVFILLWHRTRSTHVQYDKNTRKTRKKNSKAIKKRWFYQYELDQLLPSDRFLFDGIAFSSRTTMRRRWRHSQGERSGCRCGTVIALGATCFSVTSLSRYTTTTSRPVDTSGTRCSSRDEKWVNRTVIRCSSQGCRTGF